MAGMATLNYEVRKGLSKAEKKRYLKDGYVIGVINGKGQESIPVAVKKDELRRVIKENGRTSVIKMKGPGRSKSCDVMISEIQFSHLHYDYYHVDFNRVSLDEKVKTEVPIRFNGVDFLEANQMILNRQMDELLVTGFPQDIPQAIEADVSALKHGDILYVKDLILPEGIEAVSDPNLTVASVSHAKRMTEETEQSDAKAEDSTTGDQAG